MESFILAINVLFGAIPSFFYVFLLIGLLIFFILVFIIGLNNNEWKVKNMWIILTWPIDLINASGFIFRFIIDSRKEKSDSLNESKER